MTYHQFHGFTFLNMWYLVLLLFVLTKSNNDISSKMENSIREIDAREIHSWRREIQSFDAPLIIRNAVALDDADWTPEEISRRHQGCDDLIVKHQMHSPVFSYYNKRPLAEENVQGTPSRPSFLVRNNVSMKEFARLESIRYHYSSVPIEGLPHSLQQEIEELHPVEKKRELESIHLWMSSPGVIAYPHYDTSDNIFLQLRGKKRFYLASPDITIRDLDLYPALHPRYRQIQDLERFETMMAVTTLHPGDLLVLPAFFLHRVEALDASTSINLWSDSETFNISETLFQSTLPFESEWNEPEIRSSAVVTFLREISALLYGETCSKNDVFMFLRERYESAYTDVDLEMWKHCVVDAFDDEVGKNIDYTYIKKRAKDVHVDILLSMSSDSVRFLYFANLVEFVVLWAVRGEARYVRSFLSVCF